MELRGGDLRARVVWIGEEYRRYKALGEGALSQLGNDELTAAGSGGGNSIAIICWHLAGNLRSRFTDFLTSDGEKPWRRREEEFQSRTVTRAELLSYYQTGFGGRLHTLPGLSDALRAQTLVSRGRPLLVHEALHRSLAHVAYQ